MWGILPIKDFVDAKTRLAPALSPAERRGLFAAMVEDVLAAMAGSRRLAGVMVLTRDPDAAALARRHGARVESEPANAGQTSAVEAAVAMLAREGVSGTLALPGDIPLVTAGEIDAVLALHPPAPAVTIVPAWDRRGSNCMVCSPPQAIRFSFGNDSFVPHCAAAKAAGATLTVVEQPGIALDVDNPADLAMLLARPAPTRAHAFLEASGIARRFAASA